MNSEALARLGLQRAEASMDHEMEQAIKDVERPLLEAVREIGGIAESNALYTLKLARRIQAAGRDPLDMTLRELLQIDRECSEEYNRRMADLDQRLANGAGNE